MSEVSAAGAVAGSLERARSPPGRTTNRNDFDLNVRITSSTPRKSSNNRSKEKQS